MCAYVQNKTNSIFYFARKEDEDHLYRTETNKSTAEFDEDPGTVMKKYGFVVHNKDSMNMAHSFGKHGAEVAGEFGLHMIMFHMGAALQHR